jgi:hypothetical protein
MSFCKEKTLPIGPSVRLGLVVLGSGYFLKWEKKKKKKKKKFSGLLPGFWVFFDHIVLKNYLKKKKKKKKNFAVNIRL